MNNSSIENLLSKIRENFSLLIAIPTLFGGMWQIAKLASMSPIFIRFFSISQLISDGMFVCLILFYAIVLPVVIAKINANYISKLKFKRKNILILILLITCLGLNIFSMFNFTQYLIYVAPIFIFAIFQVPLAIISDIESENRPILVKLYKTSIFLGFLTTILLSFLLFSKFSKPSVEIENINKLKSNQQIISPNCKIIYFNDKYIFINIDTTTKIKTFRILDFEKLTENFE